MKKIPVSKYEVIAELCRRRFYTFVQTFWHTVVSEEPVWKWHIQELCNELQQNGERIKRRETKLFDFFIINVPPGSSKSTVISEMYPLWCWTIDSTQRFICGSHSSTVSEDIADKCKKIFTSELYQNCFPEVGIRNSAKTHLENLNNGERYTTSTGSGITGIHAHQIIIDDPLNPQQASSPVERETANKWISETLSTRLVNKEVSVTILVMQRLHEDDPTGYLIKKPDLRIKRICLPAEESRHVHPEKYREYYVDGLLDPVRMSRKVLASMKSTLGSYGYAGQFDQIPANLAGGIIKRAWFEIIDGSWQGKLIRFVLDTAYTEKKDNDPSGFLSYYVDKGGIVITNFESIRLEFPNLTKYTVSFVKNNGYTNRSTVRVEPKASGKSLVQQIKQETGLNISESINPTKDKVTRATSITAKLESGRVRLLRGSWNDAFLTEVCMFPKAAHDEAVDLLVMAVNAELMSNRPQHLEKYF
jgi:predicted phage terminase large subunit-like protein